MNIILAVICLVIATTGLLIATMTICRGRRKNWRQILREIEDLKRVLYGKFDFIITFADGGLIAADLIHIKTGSKIPVLALELDIKPNDRGAKLVSIVTDAQSLLFLKQKKILLIDDVVQTGRNMEAAFDFLTDKVGIDRKNIITAVLGMPAGVRSFKVDYCGFKYNSAIKLPWGIVPRHSYE